MTHYKESERSKETDPYSRQEQKRAGREDEGCSEMTRKLPLLYQPVKVVII